MPRTKLGPDNRIPLMVKLNAVKRGTNILGLSKMLGYSDSALYKQLEHPERMTIGTLRRIKIVLRIPEEEFLDAIK